MRTMLLTCDHCGKEINEMKDYADQEISIIGYELADLCAECFKELDHIVKKFCGKENKQ